MFSTGIKFKHEPDYSIDFVLCVISFLFSYNAQWLGLTGLVRCAGGGGGLQVVVGVARSV